MPTERTSLLSAQRTSVVSIPVDAGNGVSVVTRLVATTAVRQVIPDDAVPSIRHSEDEECCSSLCTFLISKPLVLIAIAALVIALTGMVLVNDCPIQKNIPIYLIVQGCTVLAALLQVACIAYWGDCSYAAQRWSRCIAVIITHFLLAGTIAGAVWTYGVAAKVDTNDPESPLYCNEWVYMCAYVSLAGCFSAAALFCCLFSFSLMC